MPQHGRNKARKRRSHLASPKAVKPKSASGHSLSKLDKFLQIFLAGAKIASLLIWVTGNEGPHVTKLVTIIQYIFKKKEEK